jgi:predicted RNase H-like nuclease (RuvC/YqgF family)
MASLRAKLKSAEREIQHYVAALEAENLKLHRKIGRLQADNTSLKNEVKVLVEENEENKRIGLAKLMEDIGKRLKTLDHDEPPENAKE